MTFEWCLPHLFLSRPLIIMKRGRPRKWSSDAERKREYRKRKKEELEDLKGCEKKLVKMIQDMKKEKVQKQASEFYIENKGELDNIQEEEPKTIAEELLEHPQRRVTPSRQKKIIERFQ